MITATHRIRTALALALAAGAIVPASASAGMLHNGDAGPATPVRVPELIVRSAPARGFDWGDAAIGAAGGLGLSLVGIGGALAKQRRSRRTHRPLAAS